MTAWISTVEKTIAFLFFCLFVFFVVVFVSCASKDL